MGYIRKKICANAGCKDFALPDSAYCQAHQKNVSRGTTSKHAEFYSTIFWKKMRKKWLTSHIWCQECLRQGKHTLANTIHHSKGFNSWETFIETKWWEAWCGSCHSAYHTHITNEELYEKHKTEWNEKQ